MIIIYSGFPDMCFYIFITIQLGGDFYEKNIFANHADMNMIQKSVIQITESHLEQHSKIFQKIGYAHSAVLVKMFL